jgi:hypothetical protein
MHPRVSKSVPIRPNFLERGGNLYDFLIPKPKKYKIIKVSVHQGIETSQKLAQ